MKRYVYFFGYCTPDQIRRNEQHGWDDEDSAALLIMADSEEQALEWGRAIAEAFVCRLFNDQNASWKAQNFADGVETDAAETYSKDALIRMTTVNYGEYPDWRLLPSA
jgi:hypothetical protein